jgi:hypothetical protein
MVLQMAAMMQARLLIGRVTWARSFWSVQTECGEACEAVFAQQGKSPLLDKLSKTRSNLLRMWIDP